MVGHFLGWTHSLGGWIGAGGFFGYFSFVYIYIGSGVGILGVGYFGTRAILGGNFEGHFGRGFWWRNFGSRIHRLLGALVASLG